MHKDLLAQAETLARLDRRKPKQANLRRAISSAYYAVFHFLVDQACSVQIGAQHGQGAYRHALGRAFSHTVMKQACVSFGGGTLRDTVIKGLPRDANGNYVLPQTVIDAAKVFADLQEKRHRADYDLTERFQRSDVLGLIENVETVLNEFDALPPSDDKKFLVHPTKAYFVSWIPRILSFRNSGSRKP